MPGARFWLSFWNSVGENSTLLRRVLIGEGIERLDAGRHDRFLAMGFQHEDGFGILKPALRGQRVARRGAFAVNITPVHIAGGAAALEVANPAVSRIAFRVQPFWRVPHPTHDEGAQRDAMADDDYVTNVVRAV